MSMRHTLRLVAGLALVASLGVAGCSSKDTDSVAQQAKQGDNKGYVSGDGTIERIAVDKRNDPVVLAGTTLTGDAWSSVDHRGQVVVVNVWGSWCPPCVSEAADLQRTWTAFQKAKKPVQFVGVNVRESAASGLAFQKRHGITYPSLADESGVLILSLQGKVAAQPTTLVLDPQGRIAARVSGPVDDATLTGLVDDVLAGARA